MKEVSYILIPGLGDQKRIFGWFYEWVGQRWRRKGMRTLVFKPLWVSAEKYEQKYDRLVELVEAEQAAGRGVVLVGISAGDTLALLAMDRLQTQPTALISVCGFINLKESDRHNSMYAQLSWYRAGDAAEKAVQSLSAQKRADTLCLIPQIDKIIEPERQEIDDAQLVSMRVGGHLWGIVVALLWRRRLIQKFVDERI